jgi:hypothetical protein
MGMNYFFRVIGKLGWPMYIVFAGALFGFGVSIIAWPIFGIPFTLLFVVVFWKVMFEPMVKDERLNEIGVEADAKILSIYENGSSLQIGGSIAKPGMTMELEVHPRDNSPYRTKLNAYISMFEVTRYQPGTTLRVKYDPAKPSEVTIIEGTKPLANYVSDGSTGITGDQATLQSAIAELDQLKKDQDDLLTRGTQYEATVLSANDLGVHTPQGVVLMSLLLEIHSPSGKYQSALKAPIMANGLEKYKPGKTVFVRVDPENINRVVLAGSPETHGQQYTKL